MTMAFEPAGSSAQNQNPNIRTFLKAAAAHARFTSNMPAGQRIVMRMIDLSGLSGLNLDLRSAILTGCTFTDAMLRGSRCDAANLQGADFSRADLSGCSFVRTDMRGANLTNAKLNDAILRDADLRPGKILRLVNGREEAEERATNMTNTQIERADFSGADLSGALLKLSSAGSAIFPRSNLFAANLAGADLTGADFSGAKLREANLVGAQVAGAKFTGADLSGANLRNVDLSKCNLDGADLSGAVRRRPASELPDWLQPLIDAHSVWINTNGASGTRLDLGGRSLIGLDLSAFDLRAAMLRGADLHNVQLAEADLTLADISEANLNGANLDGAVLDGANLAGSVLTKIKARGTRFLAVPLRDPAGRPTGRNWPANLSRANFSEADLRGCRFGDARREGMMLAGANTTGSDI
ncbi:pentapeptide repeat-containing protein [Ferrovibrio sp.]|uniref:pentapeptide repeat-containing protein n=1 Tax=Ferrovibrio sp. TaxID=1917215 RepID=UPI003D14F4BD